jgi:hypothetical protein
MKKNCIIIGSCCFIAAVIAFCLVEKQDLPFWVACCAIGIPLLGFVISMIVYEYQKNKKENVVQEQPTLEKEFASFITFIGEEALEGKTGGYFVEKSTCMSPAIFAFVIRVGTIPPDKEQKYFFLGKEKANRLLEKISITNHLSSYESRNQTFVFPENNQPWGKWGGAIFIDNFFTIYSFSGFPELVDEAFVCWVALQRKELSMYWFKVICERRADNPFLQKMLYYALRTKKLVK